MGNGSLYGLIHNPAVRLTSSQMIKITVEIALAMNYLHQHEPIILHRDLKSSNVLISESWTVKVSEWVVCLPTSMYVSFPCSPNLLFFF